MTWDGKERRQMNDVDRERDRMITEIHTNVEHLLTEFTAHKVQDDLRFEKMGNKIDWQTKIIFMGLGALGLLKLIFK